MYSVKCTMYCIDHKVKKRTKEQKNKRTKVQKNKIFFKKVFEVLCCLLGTCTFLFLLVKPCYRNIFSMPISFSSRDSVEGSAVDRSSNCILPGLRPYFPGEHISFKKSSYNTFTEGAEPLFSYRQD